MEDDFWSRTIVTMSKQCAAKRAYSLCLLFSEVAIGTPCTMCVGIWRPSRDKSEQNWTTCACLRVRRPAQGATKSDRLVGSDLLGLITADTEPGPPRNRPQTVALK